MYTSLEQSKKLAEILPFESADMHYYKDSSGTYLEGLFNSSDLKDGFELTGFEYIPCWSLTSLLNYLREINLFPEIEADEHGVKMFISYFDEEEPKLLKSVHSITVEKESFIDACYEIIVKLNDTKNKS